MKRSIDRSNSGTRDLGDGGGIQQNFITWQGDGKLVLFAHAASLCAGVWQPVVDRLPGVAPVAFDQRGHGDSDAPEQPDAYGWEAFGADFRLAVLSVTDQYGRAPDACVTHSFAGDCALMELAERPLATGRMILLDPVLADAEGATTGAERLAKGTRRLGEKESEGFASEKEVEAGLEKVLRAQLARDGLNDEAKSAFATYGTARDAEGRWRLKCNRQHEAEVYAHRVALADHLESRHVDAEVHLGFASKRRGRPEDQDASYARDLREAQRVVARCRTGQVHLLPDVGHFIVLEAPEVAARFIERILEG